MRLVQKISLYVLAVLGILLVTVAIVNHGVFLYDRLTSPPPDEGFVIAEASLSGDDAFSKVSAVAEPIHQPVSEDLKRNECEGSLSSFERCYSLLSGRADALQALDQWLASPAIFKLAKPVNLGWHIRDPEDPLTILPDTPIPNRLALGSLSRLLVARSMVFSQKGNVESAIRDLETIFSLGSYLQQNPTVLGHAVGRGVQRRGLRLIVGYIDSEELDGRVERLLPDPDTLKAEYRMAIGREWQLVKNVLYGFRYGWSGPMDYSNGKMVAKETSGNIFGVFEILGVYSREDSLRQWAEGVYSPLLHHLDSGRLGTSFFIPPQRSCSESAWNPLFAIRNPIGRVAACSADPSRDIGNPSGFLSQIADIGQTIDAIQATRIILAARRFYRDQKRWPTQEAELIPAYLKAWPTSALDGQPLRWMDDRSGIVLLDLDGKTICKTKNCQFPFSMPQQPGPEKSSPDSLTRQVLPSLPK